MLKKLSIILFSFCATAAFAGESAGSAVQPSYFGPDLYLQTPSETGAPSEAPMTTYAGRFFGWLVCGDNTTVKTTVTALLTYCVAYTLYQTARGVGSTVWTWWKGEMGETLSPSLQRQIEIATAEAIRRNGLGQMAIRRAPSHHDEGTCTCGNCCEARRVRQ